MKICIRIPIYGRETITKLFLKGFERLVTDFERRGVEVYPLFVVSTDSDEKLIRSTGYEPTRLPNKPIGLKHNESMRICLAQDWDYFLGMGSDNFITSAGIALIEGYMRMGLPFFGFNSLFVVDSETLRCKEYRGSTVFGVGRAIRRDVIEATIRQIGRVWDNDLNQGLDNNSGKNIYQATGVKCAGISLPVPITVDLKSDNNINSFDKFPSSEVNYHRLVPELKHVEEWVKLKSSTS